MVYTLASGAANVTKLHTGQYGSYRYAAKAANIGWSAAVTEYERKKALLILISGVAVLGIVFGVAGTGKNVLLQPEQEAYPAGTTEIHFLLNPLTGKGK